MVHQNGKVSVPGNSAVMGKRLDSITMTVGTMHIHSVITRMGEDDHLLQYCGVRPSIIICTITNVKFGLYTVCHKTTQMLHTITSTHINRYW